MVFADGGAKGDAVSDVITGKMQAWLDICSTFGYIAGEIARPDPAWHGAMISDLAVCDVSGWGVFSRLGVNTGNNTFWRIS